MRFSVNSSVDGFRPKVMTLARSIGPKKGNGRHDLDGLNSEYLEAVSVAICRATRTKFCSALLACNLVTVIKGITSALRESAPRGGCSTIQPGVAQMALLYGFGLGLGHGDLMQTQVAPARRACEDGNHGINCQIRLNGDS